MYRPPEGSTIKILTTLFGILVRVVAAVVLAVTLPAPGLTKGVVALELILRAVSNHWTKRNGEKKRHLKSTCVLHQQYLLSGVSLLPPLSHFSSSLPSKQSASASQCHRSGMQWLFLHWYWSLSHFTSQPFCAYAKNCA